MPETATAAITTTGSTIRSTVAARPTAIEQQQTGLAAPHAARARASGKPLPGRAPAGCGPRSSQAGWEAEPAAANSPAVLGPARSPVSIADPPAEVEIALAIARYQAGAWAQETAVRFPECRVAVAQLQPAAHAAPPAWDRAEAACPVAASRAAGAEGADSLSAQRKRRNL